MDDLHSPKHPIALRPEHIARSTTTIRIKQHSTTLSSGNFTITRVPDSSNPIQAPETLFTVDSDYPSFSQRRHFRDASGLPLFEISRRKMGVTWYLHLPGDGQKGSVSAGSIGGQGRVSGSRPAAEPIATVVPKFHALKDKFDVYFRNAADDQGLGRQEDVVLEVRGQNVWKSRTNVYYHGKVVMVVKLTDLVATYLPFKRPTWEAVVAEGVDVSLAAVLAVLLATLLYESSGVGRKPDSDK
ncbi:tubby C-terminal-like domain-containing protein [Aspergillus unguis]